jgi:hypothetical protein
VQFYEDSQKPKSPTESWASDDGRVTRSLVRRAPGIAAGVSTEGDRYRSAKALLGFPQLMNEQIGPQPRAWIARTLPDAYPSPTDPQSNSEAIQYLWVTRITRSEQLGASPGMAVDDTSNYPGTRYSAEYNQLSWFVRDDTQTSPLTGPLAVGFAGSSTNTPTLLGVGVAAPGAIARPDEGWVLANLGWAQSRFITRTRKRGSRIITLRQGMMQNARTGNPVRQGLAVKESVVTVKYTWHQVPLLGGHIVVPDTPLPGAVPNDAISYALNSTNSATFDGYPTGTLLLTDVEEKIYQNGLGTWLADLTYTMSYLPHLDTFTGVFRGWNSVLQVERLGGAVGALAAGAGARVAGRMRYDWYTTDGQVPNGVTSNANAATNVAFPPFDFTCLFRPSQI